MSDVANELPQFPADVIVEKTSEIYQTVVELDALLGVIGTANHHGEEIVVGALDAARRVLQTVEPLLEQIRDDAKQRAIDSAEIEITALAVAKKMRKAVGK